MALRGGRCGTPLEGSSSRAAGGWASPWELEAAEDDAAQQPAGEGLGRRFEAQEPVQGVLVAGEQGESAEAGDAGARTARRAPDG